jgi:hypothetical protein
MGIYRDAAQIVIKRQVNIYGFERVKPVAKSSGYDVDTTGNILSVSDEEKSLLKFWERIRIEMPIAVMGCRITLMHFFYKANFALPKWLQ